MKKNFRKIIFLILLSFIVLPNRVWAVECMGGFGKLNEIQVVYNESTNKIIISKIPNVFSKYTDALVLEVYMTNPYDTTHETIAINESPRMEIDLNGKYNPNDSVLNYYLTYRHLEEKNLDSKDPKIVDYIIESSGKSECQNARDDIWKAVLNQNYFHGMYQGKTSSLEGNPSYKYSQEELNSRATHYTGDFLTIYNQIGHKELTARLEGTTVKEKVNDDLNALQCFKEQNNTITITYVKQKKAWTQNTKSFPKITSGKQGQVSVYCMEILSITFGRPIALVAGMGFSYDIKIDTRAMCDAQIDQMPTPPEICKNKQRCHSPFSGTSVAAGPNEQFDQCIQSCDDGKYTQNCINSCYNKVYLHRTELPMVSYNSKKIQPVQIGDFYDNGQCTAESYEYLEDPAMQNWIYGGAGPNVTYTCRDDGFITAASGCNYDCYVVPCDTPGTVKSVAEQQKVLDARMDEMLEIINAANNTISSEFNAKEDIESIYKARITNATSDNENYKVDLTSKEVYRKSLNLKYTSINRYTREASNSITYRFPEAYRSYLDGRWEKESYAKAKLNFKDQLVYGGHNFYTALKSLPTNEKWWSWRTQFDQGNVDASNVPNADDPDNIDTTLTNLGFLGWDFDVNCFYALSGPGFYNKGLNFVFRPIDLTNVHHGRDPRWNWSESAKKLAGPSNEAELKISKKPYIIDPIALTKDIQKKNYNIYDMGDNTGETPDYTLDLTASTMRKIRSYNASKKQNYLDKDLNCDKRTETGILICKSKFLDDSGFVTRDTAQIGCNNYDPYSKQCAMIME